MSVENLTHRFLIFTCFDQCPDGGNISFSQDVNTPEGKFHLFDKTLKTYTSFFGGMIDTLIHYFCPFVKSQWAQSVEVMTEIIEQRKTQSNFALKFVDIEAGHHWSEFAECVVKSMVSYARLSEKAYTHSHSDSKIGWKSLDNDQCISEMSQTGDGRTTAAKGFQKFIQTQVQNTNTTGILKTTLPST